MNTMKRLTAVFALALMSSCADGPEQNLLKERDVNFYDAIRAGDVTTIRQLISNGHPVAGAGSSDVSPLAFAFQMRNNESQKALLCNGASPVWKSMINGKAIRDHINGAKDQAGLQLFNDAVNLTPRQFQEKHCNGYTVVVAPQPPRYETIPEAINLNHLERVKELLANGEDPEGRDGYGQTHLMRAFRQSRDQIALALMCAGASPYAVDNESRSVGQIVSSGLGTPSCALYHRVTRMPLNQFIVENCKGYCTKPQTTAEAVPASQLPTPSSQP